MVASTAMRLPFRWHALPHNYIKPLKLVNRFYAERYDITIIRVISWYTNLTLELRNAIKSALKKKIAAKNMAINI